MRDKKVNLGFIQAFLAALPEIATATGLTLTADKMIKTFNAPEVKRASIPGKLAQKGFSGQIAKQLKQSNQKLQQLQQKETKLAKMQKELENKVQKKAKIKALIAKYGPYAVMAAVGIGTYLLVKR